jgi:hypothetical protein
VRCWRSAHDRNVAATVRRLADTLSALVRSSGAAGQKGSDKVRQRPAPPDQRHRPAAPGRQQLLGGGIATARHFWNGWPLPTGSSQG